MIRASLSRTSLRLFVAAVASAAAACSALTSVDELSENHGKPAAGASAVAGSAGSAGGLAGAAGEGGAPASGSGGQGGEGGSGGSSQAGSAGAEAGGAGSGGAGSGGAGSGGAGSGGAGAGGAGAGGAGSGGAGGAGAAGAGAAGAGAGGAGGQLQCPGEMTLVGKPDHPFCIDNFEVTQSQYRDFLEDIQKGGPPPITQACQENNDWKPHKGPLNSGCTEATFTPDATPNRPVVCIDWCDAQSYCAFRGKFLCRGLDGASSKNLDNKSPLSKQEDMWWLACTSNGENLYSYGKALLPKACNMLQPGVTGELEDAGASPGCKVPGTQLADLNGNAKEWVNACIEQDGIARCATAGGSFLNQPAAGCDQRMPFDPKQAARDIGFRCCKE